MACFAVLSDIHGNIEALDAVLRDLNEQGVWRVLVLGDTVGYGPNPKECLEQAAATAEHLLVGNHEKELVVPAPDEICGDTMELLEWTGRALEGSVEWQWMRSAIQEEGYEALAGGRVEGLLLVHASPARPVVQYVWPGHFSHYIQLNGQIDTHLQGFLGQFSEQHCFCGHTHSPAILTGYENRDLFEVGCDWNRKHTFIGPKTIFFVPEGNCSIRGLSRAKAIINPGSVGQPRDGNPAASYCIYDGDTVEFRRVPYDFRKTQGKIAALPVSEETRSYFAGRLEKGE